MKKVKDFTFGLAPFKMRRAAGGGFLAGFRSFFGYELIYEKMNGTQVVEIHSTAISKKVFDALRAEAKRNFKTMAAIVGPEDKGITP